MTRPSVIRLITVFLLTMSFAAPSAADAFAVHSSDIEHGSFMSKAQEYEGFGCAGENVSPNLSWTNAPKGTKAFAVFAYDPDAPTGSGWWHWQLINLPADVTELPAGAGNADSKSIPDGSMHLRNDFGYKGFGGACPPKGHGAHRYQFTVFALSDKLDIPKDASAALTGYMVNANAIASATIEALYKR
ncbi:MAG: YbhB/YbcL family Raf kinase inhibitor-like protein [Pseudomonadota bacterium]